MRVLHIIAGLNVGGAEGFLLRLLEGLPENIEGSVISLTDIGVIGQKMQARGIKVRSLGMSRGLFSGLPILRLRKLIREEQPDVVQTWMYHADLIGGIAAWLAGVRPIVWSIRRSAMSLRTNSLRTLLTMRACAALSYVIPNAVVCCGERPRANHIAYGYDRRKMEVIPNGFELARFDASNSARQTTRDTLGITDDQIVIMILGRFAPEKGHAHFVEAAGRVHRERPDTIFLMVGRDLDESNTQLAAMLRDAGITPACRLLGERSDVPEILSAADIFVSPSLIEGFPNAVGEAMASGLACIGTDAGDTALLIGDTGTIVPVDDTGALTSAMAAMLDLSADARRDLGKRARQRVRDHFTIGHILERYRAFYERIVRSPCARGTTT
jgi:glycosyltransferase involved in cell wall biosynthesis